MSASRLLTLAVVVALLAACSSVTATPPPAPRSTGETAVSASTPAATPSAAASATQAVIRVETPTLPPTATDTPTPTATPPCSDNLIFLNDVTVPDGSQFLPGQPIDKQWSVRNAGNCDWGPDYRLVLVSGNALGPRSEVALYPARAGAEAVIQIPMVAPQEPGPYTGRWQARDPNGQKFGNVFFIKIEVVGLPTDTPPPP